MKEFKENNGMTQLINRCTRVYKDSRSTTDLVISNNFNLNTYTDKDYFITDRLIQQVKIYETIDSIQRKYIRKNINYEELTNIILGKIRDILIAI